MWNTFSSLFYRDQTPSDLYLLLDLKSIKIITSVLVMAMYFCPISRPQRCYSHFYVFFSIIIFVYKIRWLKALVCPRAGVGMGIYVSRLDRVIYRSLHQEKKEKKMKLKGCFQVQIYYIILKETHPRFSVMCSSLEGMHIILPSSYQQLKECPTLMT